MNFWSLTQSDESANLYEMCVQTSAQPCRLALQLICNTGSKGPQQFVSEFVRDSKGGGGAGAAGRDPTPGGSWGGGGGGSTDPKMVERKHGFCGHQRFCFRHTVGGGFSF